MSIRNLQVEELKIEPKHPAFAKLPADIYPDVANRKISFELVGLGSEFANAIRICTMEEIEWKALEVDESQIKYDNKDREPDIIIAEFCKRIGLIPVRQDISDDTKFSLNVANTGHTGHMGHTPDTGYRIVHTGDLKISGGSGGSGGSKKPFDSRFRLAALSPGKVIEVNNIKVVRGFGYQNAKFNTCSFEFKVLDHVDAYYLSDKEQLNSYMTSLADIQAEKGGKSATAKSRVVIIPQSSAVAGASDRIKEKIKNNFDVVLENTNIQPKSSSIARPKHFYLSFTFFCEVDPKRILVMSLQTLKDRLTRISNNLQNYLKDPSQSSDDPAGVEKSFIEINMPDVVGSESGNKRIPTILIRGEDHIIGRLTKTVMELDAQISMINYKIIHPSNRSVVINIMHPQPIKIIIDALNKCYEVFDSLQKQITK